MRPTSRLRLRSVPLAALLVAITAVAVVALSPGGQRAAHVGAAPETAAAAAATKVVTIKIEDYEFSKSKVTIRKGQKVKWVNKDDMQHSATTRQKGGPKGPLLDKGKSYTWTARRTGTFKYHCKPHPFMKGTIVVK